MIEQGRYQIDHLPKKKIDYAPSCKSNQVENETPFFFQCTETDIR